MLAILQPFLCDLKSFLHSTVQNLSSRISLASLALGEILLSSWRIRILIPISATIKPIGWVNGPVLQQLQKMSSNLFPRSDLKKTCFYNGAICPYFLRRPLTFHGISKSYLKLLSSINKILVISLYYCDLLRLSYAHHHNPIFCTVHSVHTSYLSILKRLSRAVGRYENPMGDGGSSNVVSIICPPGRNWDNESG